MTHRPTAIERAFELARTGNCSTVSELKSALKAEGYDTNGIVGGVLMKQLRALIAARTTA